jgi:hypothetical protein
MNEIPHGLSMGYKVELRGKNGENHPAERISVRIVLFIAGFEPA